MKMQTGEIQLNKIKRMALAKIENSAIKYKKIK